MNNTDIVGLCEIWWKAKEEFISDDCRVIYTGREKSGKNGVALVWNHKFWNKALHSYSFNSIAVG